MPLVVLARESYDPRFSALYEQIRRRAGIPVIWRSGATAPFALVRALRRGAILGIPMDLKSRVPSRSVPFLGQPAPTPIGPARIALRAKCAVVVGTVEPSDDEMRLTVTATPIDTEGLAADDAGALELTSRINAELSRRILRLPHAWVWMHDRWTAPDHV
jgi:KDO2-lipid IV(A) lauroyltransferase